MKHRPERVQKLIREELAKIILKELEFGGALVTITEVEVDKQLGTARVMVSVIPAAKEDRALLTARKAAGDLQYLLMKKINIKPMPKIRFELDRGPRHAADVEKLLLKETSAPAQESEQ